MGMMLKVQLSSFYPKDIDAGCREVLQFMGGKADDNTEKNVIVNGTMRDNVIGDHVYPSKTEIRIATKTTKPTIIKRINKLLETGWIQVCTDHKPGKDITCYKINISKMMRVLILEKTIQAHGLQREDLSKKAETRDEKREKLEQFAYTVYDDDFKIPPVKKLSWNMKIPHIEDLDDVLNGSDEEIRNYFQYEIKKIISAAGHNTDNQIATKKEHEKSLSREDNTTQENDYDNQEILNDFLNECPDDINADRWEKFKQHFPHKQPYKTAKGTIDETVEFGIAQLNENGALDPELADYWNDEEHEYFQKQGTGGLYQLEKYNSQWKDCLGELASRKFSSIKT